MRSRLLIRLRPARGEDGYALLTVVAAMFVLTILATGALAYSLNGVKSGKKDSDWSASLAAAQAGVDDFLAKLNADEGYWKKTPHYGITSASTSTVDCTNTAMQIPVTSGPAPCGWTSTTPLGWKSVASSTTASFHYDPDTSRTLANGIVKLTSTGRVGSVTRTVSTQLRRGGFGEFLYLSDIETIDPANVAFWGSNAAWAQTNCSRYYYPSPYRDSGCTPINFTTGDKLNGPLHSNDAMQMSGSPEFNGATTTSYPNCKSATPSTCYRASGSATPVFNKGIAYRSIYTLPTTVAGLKSQTDPTKTANPGCLYTGPTRIVFKSNGTMQVWSPYTKTVNSHCGALSDLHNAGGNGATVTVPTNNLVYVEDVPASEALPADAACLPNSIAPNFPLAGDFNMTDDIQTTTTTKTTTYNAQAQASRRYTTVTKTDVTAPNGTTTTSSQTSTARTGTVGTTTTVEKQTLRAALGVEAKCRTGTVYVEGALKGKMSLIADNSIIVADHLTYADGHVLPTYTGHGQSVLGLIATNSVLVYHPIKCTGTNSAGVCTSGSNLNRHTGTKFESPQIHASILTLQHSIAVQAHGIGDKLGYLTIFGSMAQKFRGAVGSGGVDGTGYLKSYNYDDALKYDPPPYFLDPTSGSWGVKTFAEVRRAYPA
jgi:Tfp pilus assembly protein PilX